MEIALGVLLGLLGVALVVLAAWFVARRRPTGPPRPGPDADDLPGFLESPPGTAAAPSGPQSGWAVLAPPRPADAVARRRGRDHRLGAGAAAAAGVLLIALAVALLTDPADHSDRTASHRPASPEDLTARLSFGGVVLERHAVGITAAYPTLQVSSAGGRSMARLELPTFHCLTDTAPGDPVAAGCRRARTEYAELASPALTVRGSADRLRLAGDFATDLHPAGGRAEPTGRVYRIEVSAASVDGTVEGTLDLDGERAETADPGVNVLRRGS